MTDITQHTDSDLARVVSQVLRTTQYGWHFNLVLFMTNAWWGLIHAKSLPLTLSALFLLIIILYDLLRIQLDAQILKDASNEKISLSGLDNALAQLKLREKSTISRTMSQRCQACMRLFKIFWLLTIIHSCVALSQIFISPSS